MNGTQTNSKMKNQNKNNTPYAELSELEQFRVGMKTETGEGIADYLSPEGWLTWKDSTGFFSLHALAKTGGYLGKDFGGMRIHFIDSWDRVRTGAYLGKELVKYSDLPAGVTE